jgi:hypothetical protein
LGHICIILIFVSKNFKKELAHLEKGDDFGSLYLKQNLNDDCELLLGLRETYKPRSSPNQRKDWCKT